MPLPLFNDLIKKQVEIKKKEKEAIENMKTDQKGRQYARGKIYRNK